MGRMICKWHGKVGFVETCSHIAKRIDERKSPNGRRFTLLGCLLLCNDCFNFLGFERFVGLASLPLEEAVMIDDGSWEAYETAYNATEGRRLFCLKCVAELESQSSTV